MTTLAHLGNSQPAKFHRPQLLRKSEPDITWRDYPRIEPGEYKAYCRKAETYRDPQYKRWVCLLQFDILSADLLTVVARVPLWMNLGNGPKAHASHRSKYLQSWIQANGGPPTRGD